MRRPSALREIAIGVGVYAAYLGVRRLVLTPGGREQARRNAVRLAAAERRLGIDVEPLLQQQLLRSPRLVHPLNAGYAIANVMLSAGLLVRLYRSDDPDYRRERRAAVAAYAGSLPFFLALPTAPPRTLDGYIDTIASSGVDIEHPFLLRFYNPIAAMPSLHVAFAVVTGVGMRRRSRSRLAAAVWRAYPPGVAAIVVATGNHFVLDCAAGAALGALARRLTR